MIIVAISSMIATTVSPGTRLDQSDAYADPG